MNEKIEFHSRPIIPPPGYVSPDESEMVGEDWLYKSLDDRWIPVGPITLNKPVSKVSVKYFAKPIKENQ